MGFLTPRNKPSMKGNSDWTVIKGRTRGSIKKKLAEHNEQMANHVECKKKGCSQSPGGHRFKQEGAQDYCKKHAHPDNR